MFANGGGGRECHLCDREPTSVSFFLGQTFLGKDHLYSCTLQGGVHLERVDCILKQSNSLYIRRFVLSDVLTSLSVDTLGTYR